MRSADQRSLTMIPRIVQPRYVFHQPSSKGYATSALDTMDTAGMNDPLPVLPPLPHRESTIPTRTRYPVRGSGAPRSQSVHGGLGNGYNDASEHMLRRKTPNGTLAAGYDGTPVNWSSRPPPFKHMVLPLDGPSTPRRNDSNLNGVQGGVQQRDNVSYWNYTTSARPNAPSVGRSMHGNGIDRVYWEHLPTLSNSDVPVINGSIRQPASFHTYNTAYIPTVLQPPYQPAPVPTASNDDGLYGPYWPDGRFVPYRPAAFSHQHHLMPNQGPDSCYNRTPSHDLHTYGQAIGQNMLLNGQFLAGADGIYVGQVPRYKLDNLNPATILQHHQVHSNRATHGDTQDGNRSLVAHPVTRSSDFKERTLHWAHSVYVELLSSLHQSKREERRQQQSRQNQGSKRTLGTTIFPKPPCPPTSASAVGAQWGLYPAREPPGFSEKKDTIYGVNTYHWDTYSTIEDASITPRWDDGRSVEKRHAHITGQEGAHYASPFQPAQLSDAPLLTRARNALEMLTALCEQANWCWIDGMLLSGCLAYGLEEYQQAFEWYSKILLLDSKHVEAISNLAATLLCLNRRDEAQKRWLQAVRLRPSYFEAVEHLVGILCADHRGKDAVTIIEFVERCLRLSKPDPHEDAQVSNSWESCYSQQNIGYQNMGETQTALPINLPSAAPRKPGYGSSGFSIPGSENGRILALVHAKGNMLYALGDIAGASKAFEDAVLISTGKSNSGIQGLICNIVRLLSSSCDVPFGTAFKASASILPSSAPLLLPPDKALQTASLVFAPSGELPGLRYVSEGLARKAAVSTTSNSLLSLAKIYQDVMSSSHATQKTLTMPTGIGDILALYYLSLSLAPSPSTANNVGILLASIQTPISHRAANPTDMLVLPQVPEMSPGYERYALTAMPGVLPGSGVALALAYYNYGLNLDAKHAHLYTNLGSLLKDLGQLTSAIKMYEHAVACDGTFDIALANLANAVKDQGRTSDAIEYYRRAVAASPDFAEAVCGLANALNSVCSWAGRGGIMVEGGMRDRWHVDDTGMITEARNNGNGGGWMKRVVDIVAKQLKDGSSWGRGTLHDQTLHQTLRQVETADTGDRWSVEKRAKMQVALESWAGHHWEGARVVRLMERATKRALHRWYKDRYIRKVDRPASCYPRPLFPTNLPVPPAPTVLPFHTFTCPLSAKEIRMISQRNALRISCSTLRASWTQGSVFRPPAPPRHHLNVGYVSSDFNNHPLAHLMQSVFGFHDPTKAKAICYATTASDNSNHRQQIEREAPVFHDASTWSAERLVQQILDDGIHILVNLNGYTRGARNEIFAARPAPIQMAFMGFAGTLGAEWCDYLLADDIAIPPDTLRPWRRNLDLEDQLIDEQSAEEPDWVYSENIIFCRDTFFCCDHAQSELQRDAQTWEEEQSRRWRMRKDLFPSLSDDAIILGNFNQLYKIEPSTFRTWLRILDRVPNAILWLLRFPDLGESNLKRIAHDWAGEHVASRIWFTDVAPKQEHISRARVCDLFLDTPECNAHTTAADVLWSSTPLLTLPRYKYKMCSRMAASILIGALPKNEAGDQAAKELIAQDDDNYEELAISLARSLSYEKGPAGYGVGAGRLAELRRLLYESRWTCALFNTRRWVSDLEMAYQEAWKRWVNNEGGDIHVSRLFAGIGVDEVSKA